MEKFSFIKTLKTNEPKVAESEFGNIKPFTVAKDLAQRLNLGVEAVEESIRKVATKHKLMDALVTQAFVEQMGQTPEEYVNLVEASAGATGAGGIAIVAGNGGSSPGSIGAGFNPDGDWGIYEKPKKEKAKGKKSPIIKRNPIA